MGTTVFWVHTTWLSCRRTCLDLEVAVPCTQDQVLQLKKGLLPWTPSPGPSAPPHSNPGLQGANTSRGYGGLRGIPLVFLLCSFLISFLFFIKVVWIYNDVHVSSQGSLIQLPNTSVSQPDFSHVGITVLSRNPCAGPKGLADSLFRSTTGRT